jgi:hypothetical protein
LKRYSRYSKHEHLKLSLTFIDAHRDGGEGGTSCTPSKDFEKLDHKNAIKYENIRPPAPPRFSHKTQYPPQKNLKMTASMLTFIFETKNTRKTSCTTFYFKNKHFEKSISKKS